MAVAQPGGVGCEPWLSYWQAAMEMAYPPALIDWSMVLLTITLPVLPPKASI